MYQILGDLRFVKIYLDDKTIHSKSFEEHVKHVSTVLKRVKEANLRLNGEKCTWFSKEVRLLGHIVNSKGVSTDPNKIRAITEMNPPQNLKQLQQYLGLCNYYRRFIQDFSKLAAPLFKLLKKEEKFVWSTECQEAFEALKDKLISYPILRSPDFSKDFILYTDASGYAIGAILSQKDDENREYVCLYASRILKGAELQYGITEKECLAVVWGIKQFRIYLHGKNFLVITDHSALAWLMSIKDPTGRLARWSIYLQSYEYEIKHRQGLIHSNVDALSRPVMSIQVQHTNDDHDDPNSDPYDNEALLNFIKFGRQLPGNSKKKCKKVLKLADHYKFENDKLWYRRNKNDKEYLEVPSKKDRYEMINLEHLLGHFQTDTVLTSLQIRFYWPKMKDDIRCIINKCSTCNRHNKVKVWEHPANAIEPTGIFDRIGIDLILGLPETKEGYKGILVITEYLSKYPYAVPIKSKTAEEIAENLFH